MFKVLNANISSEGDFDAFYKEIDGVIHQYPYYQYKNYPSRNDNGWVKMFMDNLTNSFNKADHYIFHDYLKDYPIFIIYHINKWDEDHFGFRMAKSIIVFSFPDINKSFISGFIKKGILKLKELGVKFVSTRINGDNLSLINSCFENGFEFYETIIWPIVKTSNLIKNVNTCRVLSDVQELNVVKNIAEKHQYRRGHYHCDRKFDISKVNLLYSKWVETSFYSDDYVCLIEEKNNIAGYFVCGIDMTLEKFLGYKYGRLKSLALSSEYRGKGMGRGLFNGTLSLLKNSGCEFIDSGYATKNHVSASLHSSNFFHSTYEEVSLHKWI